MMRKLKILICFALVFLLMGCSRKVNKVPYNEFETIMAKQKFNLVNTSSNYNYVEEAYAYMDSEVHIEYIVTNKVNEAKGIYMEDFTNIYNEANANFKGENDSDKNWTLYKLKTDSKCYFLFLYDKTYIYLEFVKSKEDIFDNIVDSLLS